MMGLVSYRVSFRLTRGEVLQNIMHITVQGFFMFLQVLSAGILIVLMAAQTTKSEGLGGTIGGKTESSFSKPGIEEKIDEITKWSAIVFLALSFVVAYFV